MKILVFVAVIEKPKISIDVRDRDCLMSWTKRKSHCPQTVESNVHLEGLSLLSENYEATVRKP